MNKSNQLKVKLDAVLIAEYENYIVYALYMNGKFSSAITMNLDEMEKWSRWKIHWLSLVFQQWAKVI